MSTCLAARRPPYSALAYTMFCAALLAILPGTRAWAQAGGLTISPVVVEVDTPRKAVAITVTNSSDQAVRLQARSLLWQQVGGADRYEPNDDLLVVPPIVELPANGSQIFRVALRQPTASPVERTYRLVLEDITAPSSAPGNTAVAFRFIHNLAVLVAPSAQAQSSVRWSPCPASAADTSAQACVSMRNTGNRRVKVQTLTLAGDGWQETLDLKGGVNVLAGAQREWRMPLQAGKSGAPRSLKVQTARGETLQADAD